MKPKPVKPFIPAVEAPITSPIEITVNGNEAPFLLMGYRFPGIATKDAQVLYLIDNLLANSKAGLIDLNLKQKQKVLDAGAYAMTLKDYSVHVFTGRPREGQTLEEVAELLRGEIEKIKKGEFEEDFLKAILRNIQLEQIQLTLNNQSRFRSILTAFTTGQDWLSSVSFLENLKKITKQDIIRVANQYYKNNYVVVYKKVGEKNRPKVEKPPITPVALNREQESAFVKTFSAIKSPEIQPVFVDFQKEIKQFSVKSVPVWYLNNTENQLFELNYVLDIGKKHDKLTALAFDYLQYLGTSELSPDELAQKWYSMACNFSVSVDEERIYVSVSGLQESFPEAISLMEKVLADAKPDAAILQNLIADIIKRRNDLKKNKQYLFNVALRNFGIFDGLNPVLDFIPEAQLKQIKPEDLTSRIQKLTQYPHRIFYYGPAEQIELTKLIETHHRVPASFLPLPQATEYKRRETTQPVVYFLHFPGMVQAELFWLH
ncbi:MAG: insulinase family protein, partial [Bacteroidia bacterium]|nr:insulinase family protein [Bacteroidia bacterium]